MLAEAKSIDTTIPAQTPADPAASLLGVYKPAAPVFVGGEGSELIADDGRRYLDFTSGIAVNALGYGDPDVAAAIRGALDAGVVHTSNLFRTAPAAELAAWLTARSFADRVFFCNSGAEATEGAIKFARKWAGAEKREIVAFRGGFHGRTMGALAATDRPAYQEPFAPLMPGVRFAEVGDVQALEARLSWGNVAAVLLEPVQAEGGVRPVPAEFLQAVRALCDKHGALLILDEVQTGLGRTGWLWAHETSGITPDIMTLAKPLAGGLPMGAVLVTEAVASVMQPGDHGSTFGGGPLVASAALATCRKIESILPEVRRKGTLLADLLGALALRNPGIRAVRGGGMLWGIEVDGAAGIVSRALESGLLLCSAGADVVRLLPPLTIGDDELRRGVALLEEAIGC
ncbi:aspartate aminotransferase family protein [Longimicrobium sp.]|uniref:aspartate aminotransferase family protein n=1 Tax=Longimicrobium sp. TaxID=2029185 RepID=UPI003B3BDD54